MRKPSSTPPEPQEGDIVNNPVYKNDQSTVTRLIWGKGPDPEKSAKCARQLIEASNSKLSKCLRVDEEEELQSLKKTLVAQYNEWARGIEGKNLLLIR